MHFHAQYTDGSFYERTVGQVVFLQTRAPTVLELEELVSRIEQQVMPLLALMDAAAGLVALHAEPPPQWRRAHPEDALERRHHPDTRVRRTLHRPAGRARPPPRVNTLLYGGLFAANARLRPEAVGYRRPGIITLKRDRPSKPSKPRNTDWAELMRHSFGLDVLACPHCGGRMRHLATVLNHASIQRILRHQGLDTPEPRARSSPLDTDLRYEPDEQAELPEDDFSQLDPSDSW